MLLDVARSQVLLVDMQEKLLPAVVDHERVAARCGFLLACARQLGVPVTASEQYPNGLGPTVPSLVESLGNAPRLPKLAFSALGDAAIAAHLMALRGEGRGQLILAGIEAHVCVLQTALAARQQGLDVFIVCDAVSSRSAFDRDSGLARMTADGVTLVTAEMVMFEWLGQAGTDDFRTLSRLIR